MAHPRLTFSDPTIQTTGVTLVVYAPFGTDAALSRYPDAAAVPVDRHPLVRHLAEVARCGVHVSALVDLYRDGSYLVEMTANSRAAPRITSRWKLEMDGIATMAGFLRYSRLKRPGTAIVLALEGHGAGYLPELDLSVLTTSNLTQNGSIEWHIANGAGAPQLPMGSPLLPMALPLQPMGSPLLPADHAPLSSYGLGQAMALAQVDGGQRVGVVHLNNCFNMSAELLHTIAPYADVATGYLNYNFFTAGEAYPVVFDRLRRAGTATTEQLAHWFADANRDLLASKSHHPTAAGVVQLSRMPLIARRIHTLARALIKALDSATPAQRPGVVRQVRSALRRAQKYDNEGSPKLGPADEMVDICSLATELSAFEVNAVPVQKAARALRSSLAGIKAYGASGVPWSEPGVHWDFSRPDLAMNILCPDASLRGLWDWRSPYYLQVRLEPGVPAVQPHQIDFLKKSAWVDFIREYHREEPFLGVLAAEIPHLPTFNRAHTLPPD